MKFFKKKEKVKKKKLSKRDIRRLEKKRKEEKKLKKELRKEKISKYDLKPIGGGIAVGIANIIPGVSGGTMLVIFNLFERLTDSISDVFKKHTDTRKQSIIFILKVLIGTAIGIVGFAKILGFTLKNFEAETIFWFVGLILFSVPIVIKQELKDADFNILFFLLGVLMIGVLQYLKMNGITGGADDPKSTFHLISLVLYGMIGGVTMIFPGVSGSMVLLVLGKYDMIRDYISKVTKFDTTNYLYLFLFGIGAILGIIISAKVLSFVIKKYKSQTVSLIIGFIIASALILPLNIENKVSLETGSICAIIACFVLGGAVNYYINRLNEKKNL